MTEETTQASDAQPEVSENFTLDDVISEFNVQAPQPEQINNVTELKPAPAPVRIDPYDEDSLNKWAYDTANSQNALQQQLQELSNKLTQKEQSEAQAKLEADIQGAVSKITEKVEGIDPLMAEIYLEKRATENPGFKAIWDNRNSNPAAYEKALGAIANELDSKFTFKVDPQLAENHRAARQSQQSNNAPPASEFNNSLEERLAGAKNEQERRIIWAQIRDGY